LSNADITMNIKTKLKLYLQLKYAIFHSDTEAHSKGEVETATPILALAIFSSKIFKPLINAFVMNIITNVNINVVGKR